MAFTVNPTSIMTQISFGSQTNIWGVDASHNIYHYNGSSWTQIPGALNQVSVAADGTMWGVNAANTIYHYNGSGWTQISGALAQVAVGSASQIYGVDPNGLVHQYAGSNNWTLIPNSGYQGTMKQVSVSSDGMGVWGVTTAGAIYEYGPSQHSWSGPATATNNTSGTFVSVECHAQTDITAFDSAGHTFQYQGAPNWWGTTNVPQAKYYCSAADEASGYVYIDMQGKAQISPSYAGWNSSVQTTVPTGYYKIVNLNSGLVAAVSGASTTQGAALIQWPDTGGAEQQWSLTATDATHYKIVNRNSGQEIAVDGASTTQGAALRQWSDNSGTNQQWSLVSV